MEEPRCCIVIPAYNHEKCAALVAAKALALGFPVVAVDDGSTDSTGKALEAVGGLTLLRHPENRGKGAALLTAFGHAARFADWAITIDADGQHDPDDALKLVRSIPENSRPIIIGSRQGMEGRHVPWTSRFGREFSNFWVRSAGGPRLRDTQSGLRAYPLPETLHFGVKSRRFQFEVEVLVRAARKGIPVIEVPVSVHYPEGAERVSHYRPFVDFLRNSSTFTRLIIGRIFTSPNGPPP